MGNRFLPAKAAMGCILLFGLMASSGCSKSKPWTPYSPPRTRILETADQYVEFTETREIAGIDKNCTSAENGCHANARDPHTKRRYPIACVDCHGGNPDATTAEEAHPKPSHPDRWPSAANPERTYVLLNEENWDWIRFVNPGDLRVANTTCGPCHPDHYLQVSKSVMTTSAHFWGGAGYCNGIVPNKRTILGESYSPEGIPQKVNTIWTDPKEKEIDLQHGVVPFVVPLPHWEVTQPGNQYRVFEQGSRLGGVALGINGLPGPLIGLPDKLEDPGRPNNRLSDRGLGTLNRVDLPILNLQKTRLNDPHLSFLGTNDHPGDYRSSGCTACHMVYANDRTTTASGPYAKFGNTGRSFSSDPTIAKDESGHPIKHEFTLSIPTSQCMTCHHHQPNSFVNPYLGYTMWSYETDGEGMWPKEQIDPFDLDCGLPAKSEYVQIVMRNPEGAAAKSKWGRDREFLRNASDLNPGLKDTQFADYHGHGWIFRAVFKLDRKGNFLDADGNVIPYDDPDKFKGVIARVQEEGRDEGPVDPHFDPANKTARRAVHLKDIHAEGGMHCVDCHYTQDVHGNQKLHSEYQAAVEIQCSDCHGTVTERATLTPTGPASYTKRFSAGNFLARKTPWDKPRFYDKQNADGSTSIWQRSMVEENLEWEVSQVIDSITPGNPHYNERSAYAKTIRADNETWGPIGASNLPLAHKDSDMTCYSCHTSWITACFGCHLPQKANMRTPMRHFETKNLRNFASYNPQVVRDDAFMLGVAPDIQDNKISTVRSSSALIISSEDGRRQKIYTQIPPTAANGMSSQAMNTHFAHAVRKTETKRCDDCHVSEKNDNNAWLAQVYLLGTNFVNFVGHNAYVGCGAGGFYAVPVTEWEEPQAVIGSNLHRLAYPDNHRKFVEGGRVLKGAKQHHGPLHRRLLGVTKINVRSVQLRGEYLFTASGPDGFRVYDVAQVSNKGFSEKLLTSPVSPLGQDTHVATANATAVALPTNNYISMNRKYRPENREQKYVYKGKVQNMHELYRYAYVSDSEEGLIVIDVDCLSDADPENNFTRRVATYNPAGRLAGAVNLTVAGTVAYVCAGDGVYAIDIDDPRDPRLVDFVGASDGIRNPRAITVMFRYAFVCDADGVKVIDVTNPTAMNVVQGAVVNIPDARDIYVARTYGYVAAGSAGLIIVDLENPEKPKEYMRWNGDGKVNDVHQVKVGMTNDTVFAYLADGKNGLRIVQLISPEDTSETKRSAYGFSPVPLPKLISTFPTATPAIAVSKGLDRDRGADESGNQIIAFGRIGGRPLTLEERQRLYLKNGTVYRVSNTPKKEAAK